MIAVLVLAAAIVLFVIVLALLIGYYMRGDASGRNLPEWAGLLLISAACMGGAWLLGVVATRAMEMGAWR